MNTRSPSPDRPRRVVTKRLRATDTERDANTKAAETQDSQANVDVGVLLGMCFVPLRFQYAQYTAI